MNLVQQASAHQLATQELRLRLDEVNAMLRAAIKGKDAGASMDTSNKNEQQLSYG